MTWLVILVLECSELIATLIKSRNKSTIEQTKFNYILEQGLTILLILLCLVSDWWLSNRCKTTERKWKTMAKVMVEVKQVDLKTFRTMFGIPEHTVQRWVHTKNFPAYKLGQKWYVDVKAFEKWRETEHANSYKYA